MENNILPLHWGTPINILKSDQGERTTQTWRTTPGQPYSVWVRHTQHRTIHPLDPCDRFKRTTINSSFHSVNHIIKDCVHSVRAGFIHSKRYWVAPLVVSKCLISMLSWYRVFTTEVKIHNENDAKSEGNQVVYNVDNSVMTWWFSWFGSQWWKGTWKPTECWSLLKAPFPPIERKSTYITKFFFLVSISQQGTCRGGNLGFSFI